MPQPMCLQVCLPSASHASLSHTLHKHAVYITNLHFCMQSSDPLLTRLVYGFMNWLSDVSCPASLRTSRAPALCWCHANSTHSSLCVLVCVFACALCIQVPLEKGYSQVDWIRQTKAAPIPKPRKDIPMQEVRKHKTKDDAWMVFKNRVRNTTMAGWGPSEAARCLPALLLLCTWGAGGGKLAGQVLSTTFLLRAPPGACNARAPRLHCPRPLQAPPSPSTLHGACLLQPLSRPTSLPPCEHRLPRAHTLMSPHSPPPHPLPVLPPTCSSATGVQHHPLPAVPPWRRRHFVEGGRQRRHRPVPQVPCLGQH